MSIIARPMAMLSGIAFVVAACTVEAQPYPRKTIRIVTSEAGGNFDMVARTLAQGIAGPLGQQVIVDNRAGVVAIEAVAKAPPDGYTLLLNGTSIWLSPFMRKNVSWDPVADFAPVTWAVSAPNVLVLHPSIPAKSVKELVALARAKPATLNYGSTTPGGSIHLAGELFKVLGGVDIVRVSYRGEAVALTSLMSGAIHMMFANASGGIPHVKSGRLRAIGVTSPEPSALLPGVPAIASGLPGYELLSITAVFAPAKTPADIIARVSEEMTRVIQQPEVKQRLFNVGVEAKGGPPEELGAKVKSEMTRMGKVIRDAGITMDY